MKATEATRVAILRIQSCLYGMQILDQYTSCGSGATSVTHNIGFDVCSTCAAVRAAYRLLKNTKAEEHSCIRNPNMKHKLVDTKFVDITQPGIINNDNNTISTQNNL